MIFYTGDGIPKEKGEYRGIGLVGVAWKVCSSVVNFRLNQGVVLHSALNRFIEGRVMGTATLESKMAQQLAVLPHNTLFQVFLDIHRTYNSLDRDLCLEVLNGYGMRPNLTRLLKPYWERQRIAPKDSKFLGKEFRMGRGLTKGESASPMIFNIVVDAVLRAVLNVVCGPQEAQHGLG